MSDRDSITIEVTLETEALDRLFYLKEMSITAIMFLTGLNLPEKTVPTICELQNYRR